MTFRGYLVIWVGLFVDYFCVHYEIKTGGFNVVSRFFFFFFSPHPLPVFLQGFCCVSAVKQFLFHGLYHFDEPVKLSFLSE